MSGCGPIPLNIELKQDDRTVCCGHKIVTATLSHVQPATMHCKTVSLSHCHTAKLQLCQTVTLSVTLSHSPRSHCHTPSGHTVTLPQVTLSHSPRSHCNTPSCHTVTLPQVTLSTKMPAQGTPGVDFVLNFVKDWIF